METKKYTLYSDEEYPVANVFPVEEAYSSSRIVELPVQLVEQYNEAYDRWRELNRELLKYDPDY